MKTYFYDSKKLLYNGTKQNTTIFFYGISYDLTINYKLGKVNFIE